MVAAAPALASALQPQPDVLFAPFAGFQTECLRAGEFEQFWGGAKGPGKTTLLVVKALQQVHQTRYRALLCRTTFGEVQELIDRSHAIYSRLPSKPQWRGDQRFLRWEFPNGSYIRFGYLEDKRDAERYQGTEPSFFGWDEFGKAKDPTVYETMLAEIRCPNPDVHLQAITTGNPGQRNHSYIKRRFITPCGENGGRVWFRHRMHTPLGGVIEQVQSRRFVPGRVWDNPIYANDPTYLATLHGLNERDRKYLLDGAWDNPDGLAFAELDARVHFVRPFQIPSAWPMFGGHDWGYSHPWVMTYYAVSEDGRHYVVDTVWGRRDRDSQIAEKVKRRVPLDRLRVTYAGSDVFAKHRARIEDADAPATSERYAENGWVVTNANTDRDLGARTLRELLAWRGNGPDKTDTEPKLVFFDTPGNRRLFAQLEGLTFDPDDPEDVLKVDANENGEGGDDGYDALRYAVHSRPYLPPETWTDARPWSINDPDVLLAEMHRKRTLQYNRDNRAPAAASVSSIDGMG